MTPTILAIVLFALGVVLVLAEVALPTHGVVGLLGGLSILGGVGVCFYINQYLGLGIAAALVVALPFVGAAYVKLWPRTPMGKRLILHGVSGGRPAERQPPVRVGQTGVTVTELRPMGLCEFPVPTVSGPAVATSERLEARSEHGVIPAGRTVRVIAVVDHKPTVRQL